MSAIANINILILVHKAICVYVPSEQYQSTRINYQQYHEEYSYDTVSNKRRNKYDTSAELKFLSKKFKCKCSCKKCKKKKQRHDKYCCDNAYQQACCQYPGGDTNIHDQYPHGDTNIYDRYPYLSSSIHGGYPYETTPIHDMFSTKTSLPQSPSFPYSPGSNFFNYLKKFPSINDWHKFFPWMTTPRGGYSIDENGTDKDPSKDTYKDAGKDTGKDTGKNTGNDTGKDTGNDTGKDTDKGTGKGTDKDLDSETGKGPGTDSGKDSSKDKDKDSGKESGKDPGKNTGQGADKDTGKDSGKDPGKDPSQDAGKDPMEDPGKDPGINGGKDNATDTTTISTVGTNTADLPKRLLLKKASRQPRCLRNNCLQDNDKIGKYFYNDIIVRPTISGNKRNFDPDYIVPIPDSIAMNIFDEIGVNY